MREFLKVMREPATEPSVTSDAASGDETDALEYPKLQFTKVTVDTAMKSMPPAEPAFA